MDIILKSNRRKSSGERLFSAEDIRIVYNLLDIDIAKIRNLIQYCQKLKETELLNLVSSKIITYTDNETIFFFEDKTFILKVSEVSPLVLASIIVIDTMGVETLEEFQKWVNVRIEKIRTIKEISNDIKELLKKRKEIERSIFRFKIHSIPNELKITRICEEIISIQKEKSFNSFKVLVEAKFYLSLLQEVCFYYKDYKIPLPLKDSDKDIELLFSPSFYEEVNKFLDLKDYSEEEIAGMIKTVINLSEGT